MIIDIIKNRILEIDSNVNIVVLKGFPVRDVLKLSKEFQLIDDYIIEDNLIHLNSIQSIRLIQKFIQPSTERLILTYESFLDLTNTIRNLSSFGKKFCVLTNNLLTNYENPTSEYIPDFDGCEFQESFNQDGLYAKFYSFCSHIHNKQYVQYIDYYVDDRDKILELPLIESKKIQFQSSLPKGTYTNLSTDNGTLDKVLEDIYFNRPLLSKIFLIDKVDSVKTDYGILQNISDILKLGLKFYWAENDIELEIRPELYTLMKKTWGYTSFRNLKMYEDLNLNRNIKEISQGEIIETVVQKAEEAIVAKEENIRNVLLTSPTGAGKSLLFQLAAIYLAEKYHSLTIIVSPLVALMNDQVENLAGNYRGVATLNGNIPFTKREEIYQKVKDGEINILYLAPELLLSYTITSFIGERRLGLFVVDEAHTVTTWGRDFRVDYWFLGDYIRQAKRVLGYSFPIFALTATAVWDPHGTNDMVFDTIRSLKMDPCIKFIGVVRRDDIHFEIETPQIKNNYERDRKLLTIKRIRESIEKKQKTIIYFPYKSTIPKIINCEEMDDIRHKVTEYHASLNPAEKNLNAMGFKTGEKLVMCATKAYGMGVDVSDIKMVYHHAPTGCLSDYVQEIGRVARDPKITGIAKIDFSEHDFKYTRTLHGLSTIKSYQLRAVLKKLMALFKLKGEKRNMLISANDFEYIFPGKKIDYDQKIKSCLLLISNDLLNKLRFNAIIVRPKDMFSKTYISISKAQQKRFEGIYHKFLKLVDSGSCTYKLDADDLWHQHYSSYSFPMFKKKLADGDIFKDFNITIKNKIIIELNTETVEKGKNALMRFFTNAHKILDIMSTHHKRLSFEDIKHQLKPEYSDIEVEAFLETFKMVYASNNGINGNLHGYCNLYPILERFQLVGHGYENVQILYCKAYDQFVTNTHKTIFCTPASHAVKIAELLNSLNIAEFERLSGDQPAIFVRINNPTYLNDLVRRGNYSNAILNSIYEKYEYSEWVFNYFFTTPMSDKKRWDFIEAYFLGASKEELLSI